METQSYRTALLITSCDAFEDCWAPYAHGLHKYWPDCPFPVYLITNQKQFRDPVIRAIPVTPDRGWAKNLRQAVSQLDADILLYTHEDFWISEPVDTQAILDYVALIRDGLADYIRLYPAPGPDRPFGRDDRLGVLDAQAPYRTSLQKALWRKSVLLDLLRDEESCWQFELDGTPRSRSYGDRFLCVRPTSAVPGRKLPCGVNYVCTAINKGRWSTEAVQYVEREGLKVDFSTRPRETWWDDMMRVSPAAKQLGRVLKGLRNPRLVFERLVARCTK
jgi:hypothetical protein